MEGCSLGKGQGTSGAEGFQTNFLTMRAAKEIGEIHMEIESLRVESVLCALYMHIIFSGCQFAKQVLLSWHTSLGIYEYTPQVYPCCG